MKKRSSKVFAIVLAAMSICTIGGAVTASAANWQDSKELIYYSGSGDVVKTQSRTKEDTSPMYLYNLPSSHKNFSYVNCIGTSTQSPKFGYEGGRVCTATKNTYLGVGNSKYYSSYVKEWGYNYCNFEIAPETHSAG